MTTTAQPPPSPLKSSGLEMPSIEWPSFELPEVDFNDWVCCVSERKSDRVLEFESGQESMPQYGRLATAPRGVPEVSCASSLATGGTG